jgi:DNA polymerase-3 subunit delta
MTDGVRDGQLPRALRALHELLQAGEPGPKLLGGIAFVFRKLAWATEQARSLPLDAALKQAGVFPRDLSPATAYLRRLGYARASRLLEALVQADSRLKGASRLPERVVLERLLLRLGGYDSPESRTGSAEPRTK